VSLIEWGIVDSHWLVGGEKVPLQALLNNVKRFRGVSYLGNCNHVVLHVVLLILAFTEVQSYKKIKKQNM